MNELQNIKYRRVKWEKIHLNVLWWWHILIRLFSIVYIRHFWGNIVTAATQYTVFTCMLIINRWVIKMTQLSNYSWTICFFFSPEILLCWPTFGFFSIRVFCKESSESCYDQTLEFLNLSCHALSVSLPWAESHGYLQSTFIEHIWIENHFPVSVWQID